MIPTRTPAASATMVRLQKHSALAHWVPAPVPTHRGSPIEGIASVRQHGHVITFSRRIARLPQRHSHNSDGVNAPQHAFERFDHLVDEGGQPPPRTLSDAQQPPKRFE
jgi:hypothetical protein